MLLKICHILILSRCGRFVPEFAFACSRTVIIDALLERNPPMSLLSRLVPSRTTALIDASISPELRERIATGAAVSLAVALVVIFAVVMAKA